MYIRVPYCEPRAADLFNLMQRIMQTETADCKCFPVGANIQLVQTTEPGQNSLDPNEL
jgi:hypothetical protein